MKEVTTFRKNYRIHFLSSDRNEIITQVKNGNNPYIGEITTDSNTYSVSFLRSWLNNGFIKIYNK